MDVPFHFPEIAYRQRGITLIESLIAIVVLSIGLLGIAGLHVQSMSTSYGALNRTRAVLLGEDLIERMLANRSQLTSYNWGNIAATTTPNTTISAYTGTTQAERDKNHWTELLQNRDIGLPSGEATVAVAQRAGTVDSYDVTIVIKWKDGVTTDQFRLTSIINDSI